MAASIARNFGIDLDRPRVDAAAERLDLIKALPPQPRGDVHGTDAVMADDHQPLVNFEFFVRAGWHFTHRQVQAALDTRGGKLPWLADIHKPGGLFVKNLRSFGRGDFIAQHEFSLEGSAIPLYCFPTLSPKDPAKGWGTGRFVSKQVSWVEVLLAGAKGKKVS
jgi:hypothetical protein